MRAPQEAACELRQALRRQKDLQETGRTSALQQGDEVLYEADFGAEEVQGSVLGALPTELEAEASYKVLLHDGKTREAPRSRLVAVRAAQHAAEFEGTVKL